MKSIKQIKREARRMFRMCLVNGFLDESRVRHVLKLILQSKRRGYLRLATEFLYLVKLEQLRHIAHIESAIPLPADLQATLRESLVRAYGPEIKTSFAENSALIGGMRIKVGSDVYDGSIKAGLAALERSF